MPGSGAEVVETPNDGVGDDERVVLEEKVLIVLHPVRSEDTYVAVRYEPEEVRLFSPAVLLCCVGGSGSSLENLQRRTDSVKTIAPEWVRSRFRLERSDIMQD